MQNFLKSRPRRWRWPIALVLLVALAIGTGTTLYRSNAPVSMPLYQELCTFDGGYNLIGDDDEVDDQVAKVIINAPEVGDVGELIRFNVGESIADSFKWIVVPETIDFEVFDNGKRAVFSARSPGEYMFIIACGYKNTVDVATHVVRIEGDDPMPTPHVIPVVPKPADGARLAQWLPYWCSQARCPQEESVRLAASFESVASTIAAGINKTPEEIIKATAQANKAALGSAIERWLPVLRELQNEFRTRAEAGILVTADQHYATWTETAGGLKHYASLFKETATKEE